MGFLQRSKSAAPINSRPRKKKSNPALPGQVPATVATDEKRSTSFERPKTADASFSRPRTANAAIGRKSSDWTRPSFKIDVKAENEVFSFPMPSPRVQAPENPVVVTKKRPSPLQELGSPSIGVAIGSPSQAPTHTRPAWGRSVTADSVSPRMPAQPPPTRAPPAIPSHVDLDILSNDVEKKRKSAWKSLGGLFCRRQTMVHVEEPLHRLKMPNAIEDRDIIIPDIAELAEYGSTPTYGPRRSSLLPPPQACLAGSNVPFKPAGLTIITRSPLQNESFSPMFRTINGIPEDGVWVDDLRKDSPLSMISPKSFRFEEKSDDDITAPQLAVLDLPDPKFERYSIMFEKLLLETSGPSLLERRQSKLNRNRSIKKLDLFPTPDSRQEVPRLEINGIPQLQRSATSPSFAKSLSLRIGRKVLSPVAEAFTTALNRPRPIRRSKTAPSLAISPRSPNFPPTPRIEVQYATSPTASFCGSATECGSLPPTPMTFTTIPDSGSVEVIETDLEPVRRSVQDTEPSWDMMMPQPLRIKPAVVGAEKRVVHVSVARQVSVGGGAGTEKVTEANESSGMRRQPLRARMVELGKNRTSAAVLIEIAEE